MKVPTPCWFRCDRCGKQELGPTPNDEFDRERRPDGWTYLGTTAVDGGDLCETCSASLAVWFQGGGA